MLDLWFFAAVSKWKMHDVWIWKTGNRCFWVSELYKLSLLFAPTKKQETSVPIFALSIVNTINTNSAVWSAKISSPFFSSLLRFIQIECYTRAPVHRYRAKNIDHNKCLKCFNHVCCLLLSALACHFDDWEDDSEKYLTVDGGEAEEGLDSPEGCLEGVFSTAGVWPIFSIWRSVINPGREIWRSLVSSLVANISTTLDIVGLRFGISCTQRRPTFRNWSTSCSRHSTEIDGSTSLRSWSSLYSSQACNTITRELYLSIGKYEGCYKF